MAQDFLYDDNNDLLISNGDWAIGDSDMQHVQDLLLSFPGHYKNSPLSGVGLPAYQNGIMDRTIERTIKVALEADGATDKEVKLTENGLIVTAKYD
jgi:hypothetical protein